MKVYLYSKIVPNSCFILSSQYYLFVPNKGVIAYGLSDHSIDDYFKDQAKSDEAESIISKREHIKELDISKDVIDNVIASYEKLMKAKVELLKAGKTLRDKLNE